MMQRSAVTAVQRDRRRTFARITLQKYPYIHRYFVASFQYFNGTGSVYVSICKSTE